VRPLPDGYGIRPPTFDDVEGVAEMLLADDLADIGESDVDADFVRNQWSAPGVDLSEDAWVITDPDRTIVAHANLSPDGEGKVKSWGVVRPEHRERGLGATDGRSAATRAAPAPARSLPRATRRPADHARPRAGT